MWRAGIIDCHGVQCSLVIDTQPCLLTCTPSSKIVYSAFLLHWRMKAVGTHAQGCVEFLFCPVQISHHITNDLASKHLANTDATSSAFLPAIASCPITPIAVWLIEQVITSQQTQYRSYRGRSSSRIGFCSLVQWSKCLMKGYQTPSKISCFTPGIAGSISIFACLWKIVHSPSQVEHLCLLNNLS